MKLWIRSQNKEKLVKVNDLSLYDSNILKNDFVLNDEPNYSDIRIIANDNYNLGSYKSKERALEVLDEIQNILKPQLLVRRNDDNDKELLGALQKGVTQKLDMEFKELSTYVYEMPKE